jgi:hypothetical protein
VNEHAIRVNESFACLTLTVNNYIFKNKLITVPEQNEKHILLQRHHDQDEKDESGFSRFF